MNGDKIRAFDSASARFVTGDKELPFGRISVKLSPVMLIEIIRLIRITRLRGWGRSGEGFRMPRNDRAFWRATDWQCVARRGGVG